MKDSWYTAQLSVASVLLISKSEVLLPSQNYVITVTEGIKFVLIKESSKCSLFGISAILIKYIHIWWGDSQCDKWRIGLNAVIVLFSWVDILSCVPWKCQHNMETINENLFCMYIVSLHLAKINVFKHLTKKTGPGKQPIAITVLNKQNTFTFIFFSYALWQWILDILASSETPFSCAVV